VSMDPSEIAARNRGKKGTAQSPAEIEAAAQQVWADAWQQINEHYDGKPLQIACGDISHKVIDVVVRWFVDTGKWTATKSQTFEDGKRVRLITVRGI